MWINGELAQTSLPPPPPAAPAKEADAKATAAGNSPEAKNDEKAEDDKAEPVVPEISDANFDQTMGRGRDNPAKKFRIGLRQGENEIVVKAVFGAGGGPNARRVFFPGGEMGPGEMGGGPPAGGSFTFNITPEGDDVLTHEVATALRLEAMKPAAAACAGAIASAFAPDASPSSTAGNTAAAQPSGPSVSQSNVPAPATASNAGDDTKSSAKQGADLVSKVGEKSAPLKSSEEENKLSPSERRKKVLREYYRSHIDPVGRIVADELSKLKDEEKLVKRRLPQTLVMEELEKPRQAYVFKRGLYKVRGENVSPATPAVLPPMPKGRRATGLGSRNGSFPVNIR